MSMNGFFYYLSISKTLSLSHSPKSWTRSMYVSLSVYQSTCASVCGSASVDVGSSQVEIVVRECPAKSSLLYRYNQLSYTTYSFIKFLLV